VGYQFKLWQSRDRGGAGGRAEHVTMDGLLQHAPSRPPTVAPELDHAAVLQPTGGTTGTLKLARLTHRALLANCTQVVTWMSLRYGQERVLAVLPMFHIYGLMLGLLSGVFSASELILLTRFDAPETLRLLREHRVTIFPMVPAICDALGDLLAGEEHPEPLRDLRLCFSGAAPLPPESGARFRRLSGSCVIEGYGLTEASPVTHGGLPGDPRPGSIGLPLPDTRVRVVDLDTGDDVAPGACGELLVSGPQVMSGYFGDPEQTRIALRPDASGTVWLHTGDVVRYDADGFFQVVDRRKDMINHSGLKVFPSRVERVLKQDDRVKEVAVVGRPDPVMTERVVAVVVPAAPPEDATKLGQELRAICREHLAPYEVPADVEFVEALPRTGLGKLLRKDLRVASTGGTLVRGDAPDGGTSPAAPRSDDGEPPLGPVERPAPAAKEVAS
jgi:long-chain acyl-CoA synthetase